MERYAAAAWSLGYGLLGLYWWNGGAGFPYGAGNDAAARISILGGVTQSTAAPFFAGLGLVGTLVGLGMARGQGQGHARVIPTAFGVGAAITLTLLIPDYRAFVLLAYTPIALLGAPLGLDPAALLEVIDVSMVNQLACIAGGLLWAAAALTHSRRTLNASSRCGRADEASWTAPAAAARWGGWATYVAIGVPIVYALTRYVWALGIPLGVSEDLFREGQAVGLWYLGAALASMAVIGAVLTLGLIRRWGEVFPRWLPIVGGRRVPLAGNRAGLAGRCAGDERRAHVLAHDRLRRLSDRRHTAHPRGQLGRPCAGAVVAAVGRGARRRDRRLLPPPPRRPAVQEVQEVTRGKGAEPAPLTTPDEEVDRLLDDPSALAWIDEHIMELRQAAYGQRILYQILATSIVLGLVAQVAGYLLKSAATTEPLGLVTDLLYTLGLALWTGAVVVVIVQVFPEAKRRQIKRTLEAYQTARREHARQKDSASREDRADR